VAPEIAGEGAVHLVLASSRPMRSLRERERALDHAREEAGADRGGTVVEVEGGWWQKGVSPLPRYR
jgi:hypothetical protein